MTQNTFELLLTAVGPEIEPLIFSGGFKPVPLEKQLLITICYLARGETIILLSDRFNLECSTIQNCISKILDVLSGPLKYRYIVWPSRSRAQKIEKQFKKICGFPGM